MRHLLIVPTAALLLAGCGGGDVSLTNASPEEVAKKVAETGGPKFKAGKWETTIQTVSVDIPGMEGPMKKQMTDMMLKKVQTHSSCMTEDQAKNPPADVLAQTNGSCKYETFNMNGGKIDGTLVCGGEGMGGGTGEMKMRTAGTFDEENFALENEAQMSAPNGPAMTIKAKTSGKRIGDCTDAEKKAAETKGA